MSEAIYSQSAYEAGRRRNILNNARKTFCRTYPRAEEVINFLITSYQKTGFVASLREAFQNYGKLTEKQYNAVCNMIDTAQQRQEAYEARLNEIRSRSAFVGSVGEKLTFKGVKIEKKLTVDAPKFYYSDSSLQDIYLMRDADGNRLVYKTKKCMNDINTGDIVDIVASIKIHTEYKGEKQTFLLRPRFTVVQKAQEAPVASQEVQEA